MRKLSLQRGFVILTILLILPLLSYTIFQILQRNSQQKVIESIYDQQLDGILFSINQYAWDQFTDWTAALPGLNRPVGSAEQLQRTATELLQRKSALIGVFYHYPTGTWAHFCSNREMDTSLVSIQALINRAERDSAQQLRVLAIRAAKGQVYPIRLRVTAAAADHTILFILPLAGTGELSSTGTLSLWLDLNLFTQQLVTYKLQMAELSRFNFRIQDAYTRHTYYRTSQDTGEPYEKIAPLWITPEMEVAIKMQGMTLARIAEKQTFRNLLFLGFINVLMLSGLAFMVRNILREHALSQMKTDFVANVSHELRTPLALIRMYAETLEMGRVRAAGKRQHYYRIIMNESNRLTQLINNILDFSRLESGKMVFNFAEEDISAVVTETLDMYQSHFEQKGFTVQYSSAAELPRLWLDRQAVMRALINLLDNAVKFSRDEKKILLRIMKTGAAVCIEVEDFGIGIPDKEQERIFIKFYRAENSLVQNTRGSGIGLALVAHIMSAHGGRVAVESRAGSGSIFSLIFPVAAMNRSARR